MNKKTKLTIGLAIVALVSAGFSAWLPAQTPLARMCCVAGEYNGSQINKQLPNCPVPKSESFTMTLVQAKGCGSDVWGKIVGPSGVVNEFKGTLSRARRGCCVISASFSDPGHPGHLVTFKGTFCKVLGKWQAKGTYSETNSSDPCKQGGTWEIKQI